MYFDTIYINVTYFVNLDKLGHLKELRVSWLAHYKKGFITTIPASKAQYYKYSII